MSLRDFLFYAEPGITLYCGDSRVIVPMLCMNTTYCLEMCSGACGLVIVTDPPYGVNYVPGNPYMSDFAGVRVAGDDQPFDPAFLLALGRPSILWGANHYAHRLPPSAGWLVWDKRCNTGPKTMSDVELAWTNASRTARTFYHVWDGFRRDSERGVPRLHPTQKPVALMSWCLSFVPKGLVVDPFMGSGTTIEAAKSVGRSAIGIEIEPRYCEVAVRRLRQEVLFR